MVFNAATAPCRRMVDLTWQPPAGACREPLVLGPAGEALPAVVRVTKRHPGGSAATVEAVAQVNAPPLSWRTVSLAEAQGRAQPPPTPVRVLRQGDAVALDNGATAVKLSPEGLDVLQAGWSLLRAPAHLAGQFPEGPRQSRFEGITAQGPRGGLALYPDRATSGVFRQDPASLEVILAYGGSFLYAPGETCPLSGKQTYVLGVYPYAGGAEAAEAVQMAEAADPEDFLQVAAQPAGRPSSGELASLEPAAAAAVSTCYADGGDRVLRLWRPYEGPAQVALTVPGARELWPADLSGAPQRRLAAGPSATLSLRSQEIVTLRAR